MGVVEAFDPLWHGFKAEDCAKLNKRAFSTLPGAFLKGRVFFQRVETVAVGNLRQPALFAALRPVYVDFTSRKPA
jgi:hypothetical protein